MVFENGMPRPGTARNGYGIVIGKCLNELKLSIQGQEVPEADFGNILPVGTIATVGTIAM